MTHPTESQIEQAVEAMARASWERERGQTNVGRLAAARADLEAALPYLVAPAPESSDERRRILDLPTGAVVHMTEQNAYLVCAMTQEAWLREFAFDGGKLSWDIRIRSDWREEPENSGTTATKHSDLSVPCPTCGFHVRQVESKPFVFDEEIEGEEPEQRESNVVSSTVPAPEPPKSDYGTTDEMAFEWMHAVRVACKEAMGDSVVLSDNEVVDAIYQLKQERDDFMEQVARKTSCHEDMQQIMKHNNALLAERTDALALIRKMQEALEVGAKTLQGVEAFVKSKEKIKAPEGYNWFLEQQETVRRALDEAIAFLKEQEGK